jgi:hypothetical protein|tara:strand:+ start:463 stop:873 length:411 start_codon:yes stop_codon:yes gene_type:complete
MIGEIIDILEAESSVMFYLNNDTANIHAIQRRQETSVPCVVVDLTDFQPQETKSHSSFLDFVTIQIAAYADNPKDSFDMSMAIRDELDKYIGTVNGKSLDIRFEDLDIGIVAEDESFVTVTTFVVTQERTGQAAHT